MVEETRKQGKDVAYTPVLSGNGGTSLSTSLPKLEQKHDEFEAHLICTVN